MESITSSDIKLLAAASGVTAHLLMFRSGEWDKASVHIALLHLLALLVSSAASFFVIHMPVTEVVKGAVFYLAGLYASMLTYRVFFHRLRSYPGPFLAKLSNFYITARSIRRMHLYEEVQELHRQYGDIVRLGPSELSIAAPEAVYAIYGSQSPITKGPWYTLLEPRVPLFMARDKKEHARRRKIWDQGFTTKALQGYDPRISKAIDLFLVAIEKHLNKPMDLSKWIDYFTFDVTEDLAFNKSSNMLRDGTDSYIFKTIRADMFNIAFFGHLPWLLPFLKRTPILNKEYLKFWKWIEDQLTERINNEPDLPDVFSEILQAYKKGPKTLQTYYNLHGDSQLIVVAGSDTTAAALTHVFFHLAWNPELTVALQKELDALPNLSHDELTRTQLLDAIINETLRLNPPVPSGTQRVTPPEGLQIGSTYIPGNTIVQVPNYTVCRDARSFERPLEFIPERWTTRPELVKDKSVFIPFSSGPYGCVGKRLAWLMMRRFIAEIVWRYDVKIAPGQSREKFFSEAQDTFTLVSGRLSVIFTERLGTAGKK